MNESFGDYDPDLEAHTYQLVEELGLEAPSPEQTDALGARIRVGLAIAPGNVCDRATSPVAAATIELRRRSLTCVSERPIAVGSVFWLSFNAEELEHPSVYALCKRCSMLTDSSFETHFATFENLDTALVEAEAE